MSFIYGLGQHDVLMSWPTQWLCGVVVRVDLGQLVKYVDPLHIEKNRLFLNEYLGIFTEENLGVSFQPQKIRNEHRNRN